MANINFSNIYLALPNFTTINISLAGINQSFVSFEPIFFFKNTELSLLYCNPVFFLQITLICMPLMLLFFIFAKKSKSSWFFNFLIIAEKELNAIDDFLYVFILIFVTYLFNFFGCFNFLNLMALNQVMVTLTLALLVVLLLTPLAMLFNFGFYFLINIRGSATTLSFFYELILDFINLTSFMLRICIQLVRLVIIGVTYYGYNHLVFTYNFFFFNFFIENWHTSFQEGFMLIARLIFEVGHTFVMFGAQFAAFCVMAL